MPAPARTYVPAPDWPDAPCIRAYERGIDFFPASTVNPPRSGRRYLPATVIAMEAPAKALCAECPHRQPCLDLAILNDERFGIWGGLNPRQRSRYANARNRARSMGMAV